MREIVRERDRERERERREKERERRDQLLICYVACAGLLRPERLLGLPTSEVFCAAEGTRCKTTTPRRRSWQEVSCLT